MLGEAALQRLEEAGLGTAYTGLLARMDVREWRDTQTIADATDVSLKTARRNLRALQRAYLVENDQRLVRIAGHKIQVNFWKIHPNAQTCNVKQLHKMWREKENEA